MQRPGKKLLQNLLSYVFSVSVGNHMSAFKALYFVFAYLINCTGLITFSDLLETRQLPESLTMLQ